MSPLFGRRDDIEAQERSAAERESARVERERRRAEREGRGLPPELPPDPPAAEPVHVEPVVPAPQPPAPAPDPPTPEWDEPSGPMHEPDTAVHESAPAYEPEPVYEPEPLYEPEPEPAYEPVGAVAPHAGEEPMGVRRVGAPSVRDLPQIAGPRPARAPKPRGVPRRRRIGARLFAVLLLALIVAAGWFAFRLFQPFTGGGDAAHPVRVTIPQGSSASEIGDLLAKRGVIDSSFFFGLRARIAGRRGELKAGTFTLRRDMSYVAALDALTKNPAPPPVLRVTIPEGQSIGEAAPAVRGAGVQGSYIAAAGRDPRTLASLKSLGVPKGTRTLEGFLFPATYELKRGSTAGKLVDEQVAAFSRNFGALDVRAARRRNLTAYDVLIIASMIEREAQVPADRRLISAVIYNRLKQHIPLGIDATLRYRLGNWSRPLRQSELQTDSAFNTRRRQGLPPTPIGSPGLASLKAALAPAKVPYIFYVVKPCGNGAHAFSSTDAQFQKDVAAYNRKRDQLGGKDPSHC